MKSIKWLIRMFLIEPKYIQALAIAAGVLWFVLLLRGEA